MEGFREVTCPRHKGFIFQTADKVQQERRKGEKVTATSTESKRRLTDLPTGWRWVGEPGTYANIDHTGYPRCH